MYMHIELPEMCWAVSPLTGELVQIFKGDTYFNGTRSAGVADELNRKAGVTRGQQAAMINGVLYGWDSPRACASYYTDDGFYVGPQEDSCLPYRYNCRRALMRKGN